MPAQEKKNLTLKNITPKSITRKRATKDAAAKSGPAIGALLRARRQSLELTLEFVAVAAEITKGFLSDVERDKASPSVASLIRLCDVLNLPIGSLFSSVGSSVIRKDERVPIKFGGSGIQDYLLSPSSAAKGQAILSEIAPGGGGGAGLYTLRCEEEFVFVLSGRVTIVIEGEETELGSGDAMTFDPRRPHTFRNTSSSKPAQALFMMMPPSR
ncbi:MAG TPA: cupin domain-containing protein [Dongiaceae bacterium]|nr:cupin domain-containing protein [Dongiaceae bacterium]